MHCVPGVKESTARRPLLYDAHVVIRLDLEESYRSKMDSLDVCLR